MTKLLALDIETICNRDCETKCDCALIPHQAKITVVGIYGPNVAKTFRDLKELQSFINTTDYLFVGHNFKFDLKHLSYHGVTIPLERWQHDTQIMAFGCLSKISDEYLEYYSKRRKEENKKLPRGYSHREAGYHSLKSLAPYFLEVEPFWENPADHSTDKYVLKDCQYTYELCQFFIKKMEQDGTIEFYEKGMMPWTKMLLTSEVRGIQLDMNLLSNFESKYRKRAERIKKVLDKVWAKAYMAYRQIEINVIDKKYADMQQAAIAKLKDKSPEKIQKVDDRYQAMFDKAADKFVETYAGLNLDSPSQMAWLLKDYFKLNIEVESRDKKTNQKEIKDSTGSEVLYRLSKQGRKDIGLFLKYRECNKLVTSFFPTYRDLQNNGILHCNFNPTGTRTGRLSSSDPNLQQVPGHLHQLFVPRLGYKFACFDQAAIEARLIAYYTEDPILYDLIKNKKDIHGLHTTIFFELDCDPQEVKKKYNFERGVTKNVGFGVFYGAGAGRVKQEAMTNGFDWSDADCRRKVERFKETYETVYKFKKSFDALAAKKPFTNLFGRTFDFTNKLDDIYMQGFNTLIQSSASDLVLISSNKIIKEFKERGIDGHVLLWVHDELVIEFPENKESEVVEIINRNMTNYKLDTVFGPLVLEAEGKIANSWVK